MLEHTSAAAAPDGQEDPVSTQIPARPTAPADAPGGTLDDWCPSRRSVMRTLASLAGVALVPGLVVACSSGVGDGGTSGEGSGSSVSSGSSVAAADVAVGTAVVVQVDGTAYVLAQPTEGEFVAYDARCTHQGTTVEAGAGTTLVCPNHGGEFDAADGGAVLRGPATAALAAVDVTLEGDRLVLG